MLVNLHDEIGAPCSHNAVNLREIFGDDEDGFQEALDRLDLEGACWIGGGAAPMFWAVVVTHGDAAA